MDTLKNSDGDFTLEIRSAYCNEALALAYAISKTLRPNSWAEAIAGEQVASGCTFDSGAGAISTSDFSGCTVGSAGTSSTADAFAGSGARMGLEEWTLTCFGMVLLSSRVYDYDHRNVRPTVFHGPSMPDRACPKRSPNIL